MTVEAAAKITCRRGECRVRRDLSCCLVCPQVGGVPECSADYVCMYWLIWQESKYCPWQARETAG